MGRSRMSKSKDETGARMSYRKTVGAHLQVAARLHRSIMARKLSAIGLYPGQEQVLKSLAESEALSMGDLAAQLKVRPPTASKTIARLSAQGLVERKSTGTDGRVVHVGLTAAGRAKAESLDAIWFAAEDELIAALDGKERKRLRKYLRRIERALAPDGAEAIEDEDEGEADE